MADPAVATEPVAPKKSKLPLIVGLVVALALGGGAAYFFLGGKGDGEAAKPVLSKEAEYWSLEPSIVVNFKDARAIRFLQVGISLMSHDGAAIKAAQTAEPRIRNALLLLFSGQSFEDLASDEGKRELQARALEEVQAVVNEALGRPGIEALYFTSFVIQ